MDFEDDIGDRSEPERRTSGHRRFRVTVHGPVGYFEIEAPDLAAAEDRAQCMVVAYGGPRVVDWWECARDDWVVAAVEQAPPTADPDDEELF